MKKLIIGILCCLFLTGCVINRVSVYKVSGDKVGFPVGGVIPAGGKNVKGYLVHWFFWTDEKERNIPEAPTVNINRGDTDDKIEIEMSK